MGKERRGGGGERGQGVERKGRDDRKEKVQALYSNTRR